MIPLPLFTNLLENETKLNQIRIYIYNYYCHFEIFKHYIFGVVMFVNCSPQSPILAIYRFPVIINQYYFLCISTIFTPISGIFTLCFILNQSPMLMQIECVFHSYLNGSACFWYHLPSRFHVFFTQYLIKNLWNQRFFSYKRPTRI